jgi:hypothetical protein
MYYRCLSCHAKLGRNAALEWFPVGKTIAFDPERGRLWVVCDFCRNWNLAPLLERWEPVNELERRWGRAVVEASSLNISLGRLRDGTSVVRVGRAEAPELAVWRYADRLMRRGMRAAGIGVGGIGGAVALTLGTGMSLGAAVVVVTTGVAVAIQARDLRAVARTDEGHVVRRGDGRRLRITPATGEPGWEVTTPRVRRPLTIEGDDALRTLRKLVPRVNLVGGTRDEVRAAVSKFDQGSRPREIVRWIASELQDPLNADPRHNPLVIGNWGFARPGRISTALPELRLALEMAVNEAVERRALSGELALVEREWREAEELASISDDLLIPERVRASIRHLNERRGSELESDHLG